MTTLSQYNKYYRTSDASGEAWHVKAGETLYTRDGKVTGNGYFPAMMQFDGSTGYYSTASYTSSGNIVTVVVSFQLTAYAGGGSGWLLSSQGPTNDTRAGVLYGTTNHGTAALQDRIRVEVQNSAGTTICRLFAAPAAHSDGARHTLFFEFDGDAGTAQFIIDGQNADDTGNTSRVAPTTGTLDSGVSSDLGVGAADTGSSLVNARLGYIGMRDVGGLDWTDFMYPDGTPKNIESTLSTVWGGPPLFWHESGKMDENKGSAGNMTKNGGIILAPASVWS